MPTFWRVFIINRCCILSKAFSASIEIIIWFLSFSLLIWCITLIDLHTLKNPAIPGINPTWSGCMILLMCCWILFVSILWGFLHLCSSVILACSFLFLWHLCLVLVSGWWWPHRMSLKTWGIVYIQYAHWFTPLFHNLRICGLNLIFIWKILLPFILNSLFLFAVLNITMKSIINIIKNINKARHALPHLTWKMLTCQYSVTHISVDHPVLRK